MAKATPKRAKKASPRKGTPKTRSAAAAKPKRSPALLAQLKALKAVKTLTAKKPKGLRARKKDVTPPKAPKLKTGAKVRRGAKAITKAAGKSFAGGLTKQIAKGFRAIGEVLAKPKTVAEKELRLRKIGIEPYKPSKRKRTRGQSQRIGKLYSEYAEFTGRNAGKTQIITTTNEATLDKARKSGMAVWEETYYGLEVRKVKLPGRKPSYQKVRVKKKRGRIFVHLARSEESARLGSFMGEKVIARTYYGKRERIFLGGADVFDRVVSKLQAKPLPPGQMITGAFFGGPSFHRAIYNNVGDLLNYLNNAFVPHLKKGVKPTKRNIAKAKAALIKNLAVVTIDNPEFEDGE